MPARFGVAAMGMGSTRTWLVNEDCEGTGTPSGWTNSNGSPNWDYTAVPLAGAQSLYLSTNGASGRVKAPDFTDITEVWGYFLLRLTNGTVPSAASTLFALANNGGASPLVQFSITAALKLRAGTVNPTTNVLSLDVTYHVWCHYLQGSGANGVVDVGFSTDGVRPTSGGNFGQDSVNTSTNLAGRVWFGTSSTTTGLDTIYDNMRVAATQIGNNGT